MTHREIERARLALRHAGALSDRNARRDRFVRRIENELERLRLAKDQLQIEFRRQLERWRTEEVSLDVPVSAIPADAHDSRLYRLTASFALICEMGLAAWIFHYLGVPWIVGAVSAFLITMVLHGTLLHVICDQERPKESVYRIRRLVSIPAMIGFLIAIALATLARYAHGDFATKLLPFFTLSLWLATVSLTLLAASLFTLGHLLAWSVRLDRAYTQLDEEESASADFLEELKAGGESQKPAGASSAAHVRPDGHASSEAAKVLLLAVGVLAFSMSQSACDSSARAGAPQSQEAAVSAGPDAATLNIDLDASGSCVRSAFEECWMALKIELPAIVEAQRIGRLRLWHFDRDGWCPRLVKDLQLPALALPSRSPETAGEWDAFRNIREAMRDTEERAWLEKRNESLARYRAALAEALKPLDSPSVLPASMHESSGTDILGLLRRISEVRTPSPELFFVLTDLADTAHRELPALAQPEANVRVLVLLLPSEPKDALQTIGEALPPSEQFELRRTQIRRAAPWITPAPYFARDLAGLLAQGKASAR